MEIETLAYGQSRPYADSEYKYIITTNGMSEYDVERYCTKVLKPCSQSYKQWKNPKSPGVYWYGYYTFNQLEDNKYQYYVRVPYAD